MKEKFDTIDEDGSGELSLDELSSTMRTAGKSESEIDAALVRCGLEWFGTGLGVTFMAVCGDWVFGDWVLMILETSPSND